MPEEQPGSSDFFLVGTSIANYPDTIQQMAKQGCEIGNHTWDHASLSSLNGSSIQSEISSTNAQIRALTGHNATLVRPPYGATTAMCRSMREHR